MKGMGDRMDKELSITHFTKDNADDIEKAVQGLDQFTKNYCMNVEETEKQNDLVFRCSECNFVSESGSCLVKKFVLEKYGDYPNFGSMGWH